MLLLPMNPSSLPSTTAASGDAIGAAGDVAVVTDCGVMALLPGEDRGVLLPIFVVDTSGCD